MNSLYECNAYACYDKCSEKLDTCSSGGVFGILATHVLRMGGYVVGAAFSDEFLVRHEIIHDEKELYRLKTSKYVQSDMGDTYKNVKELLDKGEIVLFTGTPCQAGGLRSFLSKEYENLYVVDVICHGVPSPMVFRNHLKQLQEKKGKLHSMNFRDKGNGWRWFQLKYSFENDEKTFSLGQDDYFKGFNNNWFLRESCYQCEFRFLSSKADLTIGDYWNIQTEHPDMWNNNRGVSAVIVKTQRGQQLFDECKRQMCYVTSTVEQIAKYNTRIIIPCDYSNIRRQFFDLYYKNNSVLSETYKNLPSLRVGIIGGYSSRMVVHRMKKTEDVRILSQLSNSSVISFMGEEEKSVRMLHFDSEGDYRRQALEADVKKTGFFGNNSMLSQCDKVIIDFLEERFDLYEKNGCYVTKSEALDEFGFDFSTWKKFDNEEERNELWEKSCLAFIKQLKEIMPENGIVLHRAFLNEVYGTKEEKTGFDTLEQIQMLNARLKKYYDFFEENCSECIVVENHEPELMYTNKEFMYGCEPQYHNERYYYNVAETLASKLGLLRMEEEKLDRCVGCGACVQTCQTKAIIMQKHEDGFLYPIVDKEKCISCGKCEKLCPLHLVLEGVVAEN